jgi:hypothetical protein
MIEETVGKHYMNCKILKSWLTGILPIKTRIQTVCIAYILFLMVGLRNKKTLSEASRFSGLHESQFSRFLSKHFDFAAKALLDLSKRQAKQFSKIMKIYQMILFHGL